MAGNLIEVDEADLVARLDEQAARLREAAAFRRLTMTLVRRVLDVRDDTTLQTRLMDVGHGQLMTDLAEALRLALDERDAARRAAERFEAAGERYAAAMVRGVA